MTEKTITHPPTETEIADFVAALNQWPGAVCDETDCESEGVWGATMHCCGSSWVKCNVHHDKYVQMARHCPVVLCHSCRASNPPHTWRRL